MKYRNIKVRMLPDDAAPPAGLVPLADRELDQLITQASNDNIPLIDFGLVATGRRCRCVLERRAPPRRHAAADAGLPRRWLTTASRAGDQSIARRRRMSNVLQGGQGGGRQDGFQLGRRDQHRRGAAEAAAAGDQGGGPWLERLLGAGQALGDLTNRVTISRVGLVVIGAAPRIVRNNSLVSCAGMGLLKK